MYTHRNGGDSVSSPEERARRARLRIVMGYEHALAELEADDPERHQIAREARLMRIAAGVGNVGVPLGQVPTPIKDPVAAAMRLVADTRPLVEHLVASSQDPRAGDLVGWLEDLGEAATSVPAAPPARPHLALVR